MAKLSQLAWVFHHYVTPIKEYNSKFNGDYKSKYLPNLRELASWKKYAFTVEPRLTVKKYPLEPEWAEGKGILIGREGFDLHPFGSSVDPPSHAVS